MANRNHPLTAAALLATVFLALLAPCTAVCAETADAPGPPEGTAADTLDEHAFLPIIARPYVCPNTSGEQYGSGIAYQRDLDDPVRPAAQHADKNIALRGYTLNADPVVQHGLVDYGCDDGTQPPQLATLFDPARFPMIPNVYRVHHWCWESSPEPGTRGEPILDYPVTAIGLETFCGETLHVPQSGYSIGGDPAMEVLVLYADKDTVTLRYTRDDSSAPAGYTLHFDNICTDPNLLALYEQLDDPYGPRHVYRSPAERPYSYPLPNLTELQVFGRARTAEVVVAIADTGAFQDPRSRDEWWQIRPGHPTDAGPSPVEAYTKSAGCALR